VCRPATEMCTENHCQSQPLVKLKGISKARGEEERHRCNVRQTLLIRNLHEVR
jgi:hypothetical protein